MPGWHGATLQLETEGKIRTVGIIQEQHPDRARLFMQWKGMDWPIFVDALDLLEVAVVPITVFVDEHGIVRQVSPRPADLAGFVARDFAPAAASEDTANRLGLADLAALAVAVEARVPSGLEGRPDAEQAAAWKAHAQTLFLWGGADELDTAIEAFEKAVDLEPADGQARFQLGVAVRRRYDSPRRRAGDFQRAVDQWSRALGLDPNQYIWRRRIQQYGPRLAKPYPFYDWVERARAEIRTRGETPVELVAEPGAAEIASPAKSFENAKGLEEPDPGGRILRDERGFVSVEKTVVPGTVVAGGPARLHLVFRPNASIKAHWNNEAEDLEVWLEAPPGWEVDRPLIRVPNPPQPVSRETRIVEVEVRSPDSATGSVTLSAYALYYVCEDVKGTCLYRRQDIAVAVAVE
ncbi:MAG: hypothetical protein V3T72_18730 [Thermoanaerobaculia bacterium]